jgi:predicted RNA-binding Zn-ribbon protein involved in translation (DUF1610 family)
MKRCGNCGHELKVRSFRALDNTCPHCGEVRFSKTTRARAIKLRLILYGLVACVALEVFLDVPKIVSIPFLLCPLSVLIWFYYDPFKERDRQDQEHADGNPTPDGQRCEVGSGRDP